MLLKRDPPINFVELILDLRRAPHRLKLRVIAEAINVELNTLKAWYYRASVPNYDDGNALRQFHDAVTESCKSGNSPTQPVIQSASHAARSGAHSKENAMPPRNKPKNVAAPGEDPASLSAEAAGESDVDEAIDMAAQGKARRIAKPKPEVAPSPIKGDPARPAAAPVNAKREMSYADAMAALEAGTLTRSVLTEKGWVAARLPEPPKGAR